MVFCLDGSIHFGKALSSRMPNSSDIIKSLIMQDNLPRPQNRAATDLPKFQANL
jgi:hypothetical protein